MVGCVFVCVCVWAVKSEGHIIERDVLVFQLVLAITFSTTGFTSLAASLPSCATSSAVSESSCVCAGSRLGAGASSCVVFCGGGRVLVCVCVRVDSWVRMCVGVRMGG